MLGFIYYVENLSAAALVLIKVKPKYQVSAMHTKKVLKCPVNLLCHAIRGNKKALMVRLNYDHEENELFGFVVCDPS